VAKPFVHPAPAFGPGSVEFIRRQAEELELADDEGQSLPLNSKKVASPPSSSYAGAGEYF